MQFVSLLHSLLSVFDFGDDFKIRLSFEQSANASADDGVVIGDEDFDFGHKNSLG